MMSETVLKLLVEELASIRITCPNDDCGGIVEMSLAKLPVSFDGHSCPFCRQELVPAGADRTADHIRTFARAAQGLVGLKDKVKVELVVPKNG